MNRRSFIQGIAGALIALKLALVPEDTIRFLILDQPRAWLCINGERARVLHLDCARGSLNLSDMIAPGDRVTVEYDPGYTPRDNLVIQSSNERVYARWGKWPKKWVGL